MMKDNPIMILNLNDFVAFFMTSFRHSRDNLCQKSNVLIQKHQYSKLKLFLHLYSALYYTMYSIHVLYYHFHLESHDTKDYDGGEYRSCTVCESHYACIPEDQVS